MASIILTVFFRLSGALSKFVLFLYLGRMVETAQIGLLGIIYAVLAIFVQLVGAELHYVNSREIVSSAKAHAAGLIRGQLLLHFVSYFLIVPVLSLVFLFGILDWMYFYLVLCLLIAEHLGQELFRFLQFCFRPVLGALVLFIRSGVWVFIFIGAVEHYDIVPSIQNILKIWLSSALLAVIFGAYFIRDFLFDRQAISVFTLKWAATALKKASPFFVSMACFSLFQYIDRFILNYTLGPASVGIFFFLASLASFLQVFVTFSVGVFYGPRAIRAFHQEGLKRYLEVRSTFIKRSVVFCFVGLVPALVLISPVLNFVGKADYISYVHVFFLMLVANGMMIGADFANLDLYVRNLDREMMFSTILGLVIAFIIQIASIVILGVTGAAIGAILSTIGIWITRRLVYAKAIAVSPNLLFTPRL